MSMDTVHWTPHRPHSIATLLQLQFRHYHQYLIWDSTSHSPQLRCVTSIFYCCEKEDMVELCSENTLCYYRLLFNRPYSTPIRSFALLSEVWKMERKLPGEFHFLSQLSFNTTYQTLMQALRITYIDQTHISHQSHGHT